MNHSSLRRHWPKLLAAFAIVLLCSLYVENYSAAGQQDSVPGASAQNQQQASADLLAQADNVLRKMSQMTGLAIKSPVNKKIVSRDEVRKILLHNLHTDYTPKEIHVQETTLRAFGLVSKDFDLESFLVDFYTEQVAGFYDPETKTMYIADWIPADMQGMVLSHELTHALQDQNFNLAQYIKAAKNNDDAEAARQAVVEGYATAAMFQTMLDGMPIANLPSLDALIGPAIRQQMAEFPVFSKAPFFFKLEALFPYIQGASFVVKGLRQADWKKLDELFTSPPSSTKALYQADIYFNHVVLPEIKLPDTTPLSSDPGLKQMDENILGELGCNELLGQFLDEDTATADCTGWMGDRYIVYEDQSGENNPLIARTEWASAEDALTFFRDYQKILTQKYKEFTPDPHSDSERVIAHTASGEVILLYAGKEVRWAEGVPSDKVDATLKWLESL
ncbi:MAG TPA: DUF6782 family putative metallopeptidase [Terriglobia bacterium]|nr:DUF6782 family putative metallopeptidase [Terriglobia bacterium]